MTSNITFATVIGYLMQQDFDNSFRALRGYLNGINKSEYEFLIIDLIKISLIEQDVAFSKPTIIDYDDSEFINGKLNELYEKGIILLRPMDDSRRKGIHNIVKDIPDVVSFSIGSDSNIQVVLRFKPFLDEYLDLSATAKEEQTDFDFTELIASLKGLIDPEDKKPRVKMTTDDFGNDTEIYYGIENIHELAELIVSGIDIDDACITSGLNDEQKTIATLVLARESYAQENYAMGDQYLKKVERTKNKTKFVTSLFEEIRRNKRFYRNRVDENHKPLVLTLKQKNN